MPDLLYFKWFFFGSSCKTYFFLYSFRVKRLKAREIVACQLVACQLGYILNPRRHQALRFQRYTPSCLPRHSEFRKGRSRMYSDWTKSICIRKKLLNFGFCVHYLVLKDQGSLVPSGYCGSLKFGWSLVRFGY